MARDPTKSATRSRCCGIAEHAPYVRLAGGELRRLVRLGGKRLAATTYMRSLAHEVVHYEQWRAGREFTERGVVHRADRDVREYLVHAGLQSWPKDLVSRAGSLHEARRYFEALDVECVARRISVRCLCADYAVANSAHILGGHRPAARTTGAEAERGNAQPVLSENHSEALPSSAALIPTCPP